MLAVFLARHFLHPVLVLLGVKNDHCTFADVLAFDGICHDQIVDFRCQFGQALSVLSTILALAESKSGFHVGPTCRGLMDALRVVDLRSV